MFQALNVPPALNLVTGVAVDSTNAIYVVGISRATGTARLFRSLDGVSWAGLDSLNAVTHGSGLGASALPRVTVDGCDGIHWTAQEPRDGGTNWVIQSRTDAGNHTTRVPGGTWPTNVTVGTEGTLFCGGAFGPDAGVVMSTNRGLSWSAISNLSIADVATEPSAVAVTLDGVVLNNVSGDGPTSWTLISVSNDGGSAASTFRMPGQSAGAAVAPTGARFVSGGHWALWEVEADVGAGWGVVDSVSDCAATGMFSNELGVFAIGNCADGGALARASPLAANGWFPMITPNTPASFFAVTADSTAQVYVVGSSGDAGLILRATCSN